MTKFALFPGINSLGQFHLFCMRYTLPLRFGFVFMLWVLSGISPLRAELPSDTLVYDWNLAAIESSKGEEIVEMTSLQDKLMLRADGTFSMKIAADSTAAEAGNWMMRNDSLVLIYELTVKELGIDSIAFLPQGNEPVILFFANGKEIARQSGNELESIRRTEVYGIELEERGGATFTGTERVFKVYQTRRFEEQPFSFLDILRGFLGIFVLLAIAWAFSNNRKAIDWRLVATGLGLQLVFAILVLKIPFVNMLFSWVAGGFVAILQFTAKGSEFLFGGIITDLNTFGYIFAFQVLPTILFFGALTASLYYLGILQRIVYGFAWLMSKTMRLSGAESLAAAGNIFLGQTESPFLIRPYIDRMTKSEIMCLMTGGMATIAGGVFAAYVGFLGGKDVVQQQIFATYLLTASIMSAPAAIVAAKMLFPETEEVNPDLSVPPDRLGTNLLDAISIGTADGLKLAINVGVMLLVFIAMIAMINSIFTDLIGHYTGLNDVIASATDGRYKGLSLEYLFGLIFAPVAWLLGVPGDDILIVGQLLGEKTIINEFIAYASLGKANAAGTIIHEKSVIIATYSLCGFANFSSIGIQIGGIGAIAPNQRTTLAALGMRALVGGTIACFMTGAIAGMLANI